VNFELLFGNKISFLQSVKLTEHLFKLHPHHSLSFLKDRIFRKLFQEWPVFDASLAPTLKVIKVLAVGAPLFQWLMDEKTFVALAQDFALSNQSPCSENQLIGQLIWTNI